MEELNTSTSEVFVEEEQKGNEEIVSFPKDKKMMYGVLGYDGNELMAAVTGYDLDVSFNMRLINNIADAEACANALADVFYQKLIEQLLSQKPNVIPKQTEEV